MPKSATLDEYAAFLAKHARDAFVPVVTPATTQGAESRYFGQPWLPDDMSWPTQDDKPGVFVLQLDIATLPGDWKSKLGGSGLLLFFKHDDDFDETFGERGSSTLIVDSSLPGSIRPSPGDFPEDDPLAIVDWCQVVDHPFDQSLDELEGYDADWFEDANERADSTILYRKEAKVVLNPNHRLARFHTYYCDKLGGWPAWEQGEATPNDTHGAKMECFFQIGYEGILLIASKRGKLTAMDTDNINWPTTGRGQIFRSFTANEFKYIWDCD